MKKPLRNSLAAGAAALALVLLAVLVQSAADQEEKTKVERLLKVELDEFWSDDNGWSQLHWAALANDGEAIQRLADMGAFMDSVDNEYDGDNKFSDKGKRRAQLLGIKNISTGTQTPLHVALWYNKSVAVSVLIANGADVNAKDDDGGTPLHRAATAGAAEVAKLLIDNGAEVNAKDDDGETPLHGAAWYGAAVLAELRSRRSRRASGAVGHNSAEVAKLLIDNGAEVNAKDKYDSTPLHGAAGNNAAEVAKLLIDNGAEVNAKNKYDSTPLHGAADNGTAEVAKLLIDNGAEVNAKNDRGNTPLRWAVQRNSAEVMKLLRANGATY